jgi:hypothetical protein
MEFSLHSVVASTSKLFHFASLCVQLHNGYGVKKMSNSKSDGDSSKSRIDTCNQVSFCAPQHENYSITNGSRFESKIEELVRNGTITECVLLHCNSRLVLTCGELSILAELMETPRASMPIISVLTADFENAISPCPSSISFGSKHHIIWKSLSSLCAISER